MSPSRLGWFCLLCAVASAAFIRVDTKNKQFVDGDGRARIFHGVNAVYKVDPYYPQVDSFDPQLSLADRDMDDLARWGMNVVRLGLMWPGAEPARGQYNDTYIAAIQDIVNRLGQRGIYTILDVHQDLLSAKLCGEGLPDWAVTIDPKGPRFPLPVAMPYALDAQGHPARADCAKKGFGLYYASIASGRAWQAFYDDTAGAASALAAFWQHAAAAFAANPFVLGYEIINEPFFGDVWGHVDLLKPGKADAKNLAPLYERVHAAIRRADDSHIIFYEPAVGIDTVSQSGFTSGPGGAAYDDRQVLSFHIYCAQRGNGDPVNRRFCDALESRMFDVRAAEMGRLNNLAMLTEFGANTDSAAGVGELNSVGAQADRHFFSWAYWQFKSYNDITTAGDDSEGFYHPNGTLQAAKVKALARTYAQAVAGVPVSTSFDPATGAFSLVYTPAAAPMANPVTEIFVSEEYYYGNGLTVDVQPAGAAVTTRQAGRVLLTHNPAVNTGDITVKIGRAQAAPAPKADM